MQKISTQYLFSLQTSKRNKVFNEREDNSVTKNRIRSHGQPGHPWVMRSKCTKFQDDRSKHFKTSGKE